MNAFEEKIQKYIISRRLLREDGKVLVALSGGADSVALLRVLTALGYDCIAAHCNFHLRGAESDRDEAFVRSLCDRLGVSCEVVDFDVEQYRSSHGVSTEMACRELRYDWFRTMLVKHGCQAIAVAHHRDDNLETMLLNMMRGTGITGLVGIKSRNGDVVRPLLGVGRADVLDYLDALRQDYVTDSTNLESDFMRNKIRNILLPEIDRLFPSGRKGMERTLDNLVGDYAVWKDGIGRFCADAVRRESGVVLVDRGKLMASADPLTMLRSAVDGMGFSHDQLRQMMDSERVGAVFLSERYVAESGRGEIAVMPKRESREELLFSLADTSVLPLRMTVRFCDNSSDFVFQRSQNVAYFDADRLPGQLSLRHWRHGDRFRPFGMKGSKKVSDFFTDCKMSLWQKRSQWIMTDGAEILWIVGRRAADAYRVTASTRRIAELRLE